MLFLFCRTTFAEKQNSALKLAESQAELAKKYAGENIVFGELDGSVFVTKNKEIGMLSLHFDGVNGPYVSYEHEKCSKTKFENNNVIPPRLLFVEYSFNETEQRFIGMLDYAGNSIDGGTKARYEMCFDTKYICIVSGKIVHIASDKSETSKVLGTDIYYTNTDLDNVDIDTVKRLETEGATEKTINVFRGPTCKY